MDDLDRIAANINRQRQHEQNGQAEENPQAAPSAPFPDPKPASALQRVADEARWVWRGLLARGGVTLLSALWKAGKSTLLAHLLRALGQGGDFLGLAVAPSKVLYVTEEPEDLWAERRDDLGITDDAHFQVKPFLAKPRYDRWGEFLTHLAGYRSEFPYDVLVMDTISNLWPVRDENDAAQVQSALMPLHGLVDSTMALLLVHHLRKGDGQEATASRGSGALTAFVDIIAELRRYCPGDRRDRRRVLSGFGRYREVPDEIVAELTEDGTAYRALGDRAETTTRDIRRVLFKLLPGAPPGLSYEDLAEAWPGETAPKRTAMVAALGRLLDAGEVRREGRGKRGSPHTWWNPERGARDPEVSVSIPFPIGKGQETETHGERAGHGEDDESADRPLDW